YKVLGWGPSEHLPSTKIQMRTSAIPVAPLDRALYPQPQPNRTRLIRIRAAEAAHDFASGGDNDQNRNAAFLRISGMEDLIIATGGAGFIGSNFILQWISSEPARILNLDKLTYAGNLNNLRAVEAHPRYRFEQGDIVDRDFLLNLLRREQPRAIVHFA